MVFSTGTANIVAYQRNSSSLILNNADVPLKVLSTLKAELRICTSFRFYVAFMTQEGVASLTQDLIEVQSNLSSSP